MNLLFGVGGKTMSDETAEIYARFNVLYDHPKDEEFWEVKPGLLPV